MRGSDMDEKRYIALLADAINVAIRHGDERTLTALVVSELARQINTSPASQAPSGPKVSPHDTNKPDSPTS